MADPLKYFRVEAREILDQLQRGVLELERAQASSENVPRLLRLGHTLKGAARVVRQPEIANLAHRVEDLLVPLRQAGREATPEESAQLLALVDAIATEISKLAPAPAEPVVSPAATSTADATPPRAAPEDAASTSALRFDDLDTLMDNVAELGFQLGAARRVLPGIERSRNLAEQLNERLDPRRRQELGPETAELLRSLVGQLESGLARVERELSTNLEQAGRELGQLRDGVDRLRLVPAAGIFGALERTTRDTAVGLGKLALFEAKAFATPSRTASRPWPSAPPTASRREVRSRSRSRDAANRFASSATTTAAASTWPKCGAKPNAWAASGLRPVPPATMSSSRYCCSAASAPPEP
jgi:two-component system chemotaxis sensor kinase CheA